MLPLVAGLALLGLLLSVVVHGLTFAAPARVDGLSGAWLLHVGLFVVLLPAGLVQRGSPQPLGGPRASGAPHSLLSRLQILTTLLFFYALLNFALCGWLLWDGTPHREGDGTHVLRNHGDFVRTLSESEYHRFKAYQARLFSGHWMLFYSVAATMLVAARGAGAQSGGRGKTSGGRRETRDQAP